MKYLLFLFFLGAAVLSAAEVVIHKPSCQFIGKRAVNRRSSAPGSGVVRVEKVTEAGYRLVFAIQNTSGNQVKLATNFNHVRFESEPRNNSFVLRLSHRLMSVKPESGAKAFPIIQPLESFRIVALRPGEGTLITVTCWTPEGKIRSGDKVIVEYAPRNFGRYDFMQMRIRSAAVELKIPEKPKKMTPVEI